MKNIRYTKMDPSGNISLIVDSFVPRAEQSRVAAELMARDKSAEQVGFLEKPENGQCLVRLQMMGGEFCGNASLSAAAVMLRNASLPAGTPYELMLEVSGAPEAVTVRCSMDERGAFKGAVSMPLPESISEFCFFDGFECYTLPLVRFPGICHAMVCTGELTKPYAEKIIGRWCRQLNAEALGLMFLDKAAGTLEPLVYVASTDTAVWEGSCASGTAAAAACLAELDGERSDVTLVQPRGRLSAGARFSGGMVRELTLRGSAVSMGEYVVQLP